MTRPSNKLNICINSSRQLRGALINVKMRPEVVGLIFLILTTKEGTCQQDCSHAVPCAFTGGAAFVSPAVQQSTNGQLDYTLTADMADITIEWLTLHRRAWNGQLGGPVLLMRPGDSVNIQVTNNLQLPHKLQAFNQQRYPNSTNLHTHGLHISSENPQDNVFVHVEPGQSHSYQYQVEADNPPGTYWYHPHLHGSTLFQVHSGMAGMIIVEDPADATTPAYLQAVSCPNNCGREVRLLFQPVLQYSQRGPRAFATVQNDIEDNDMFRHTQYAVTAGGNLEQWLTQNVNHFTTNGQLWPVLSMPTGEIRRFRMVNAGGGAVLELHITDNSDQPTTACTVKQISLDGLYFDQGRELGLNGKTFLVASSKADWLVVCNTAGTYHLRSTPNQADQQSMGNVEHYNARLLTLTVSGVATTTTIGNELPARPSYVNDFRSLTDDEVHGHFVIEASDGTRLNREQFSAQTDYRFKMESGRVQQLYFVNTDPTAGHPIHMHINHFQVISYNAYTGPYSVSERGNFVLFNQQNERCFYQSSSYNENTNVNTPNNPLQYLGHDQRWAAGGQGTLGYSQAGWFHDVIIVPPLSNITTRFMTHKFEDEVVIHCHLLNHEDSGMMMTIDIVAQGADLTANTMSGNAYPGQCGQCDVFPFNQVPTCDTTTTTTTSAATTTTTTTTSAATTTTTSTTVAGQSTTSSAVVILPTISTILLCLIGGSSY